MTGGCGICSIDNGFIGQALRFVVSVKGSAKTAPRQTSTAGAFLYGAVDGRFRPRIKKAGIAQADAGIKILPEKTETQIAIEHLQTTCCTRRRMNSMSSR